MLETWSGWDKYGILENNTKKENAVEPLFTDTRLIRTPRYYGQSSLSLGKAHTFSLNSTRLKRTPVMRTTDTYSLPNQ